MAAGRLDNFASSRFRSALWLAIAASLLLPLLAMQVSDEVNWTGFDFFAAAVLLVGGGLAFELVVRSRVSGTVRVVLAIGIGLAVATVWAHEAVGIF